MATQPGFGRSRTPSTFERTSLPPGPPPPISDHEVLGCIGRGSYGEVWLARNAMGQYRAVKIVRRKAFRDDRPYERELAGIRRFEPVSRSHEGFVDVLHVGTGPDCFYYVMEPGDDATTGQDIHPERYVAKTLARQVSLCGRLPFQDCLTLGLALSSALHHLHQQGLVHRDIKPSNIIFVTGVPKLADIGLVADIGESSSYVGTEGFIAPEGPGSPQADIYSLGKVLYEASTGLDRQDFPALPDNLAEFPDAGDFRELNEVVLRACQQNPRERYESAWAMHGDLLALAAGKSVKRLRVLERRWTVFKRAAVAAAAILAVLGLVVFEVLRGWRRATDARQRQVGAALARGSDATDQGDYPAALASFAEASYLDRDSREREWTHRLRLASILRYCPQVTQMLLTTGWVQEACFSPDGRQILVTPYFKQVELFDALSGAQVRPPLGQARGAFRAAFSPDGRRIITTSPDQTACVWAVESGQLELRLEHPDRVFCARFDLQGQRIATAGRDKVVRLWDAHSGSLLREIEGHEDGVLCVAFSPDGHSLLTASQDGTARTWDSATGERLGSPLKHGTWVSWAAFSPDGLRIVTASFDHVARIWDAATGRRALPDLVHNDGVESAEFSPDGRLIVTACLDGTARLWIADTGQPVSPNPVLKHPSRVMHAAFCPDGRRVVTACYDGTTRVWDLAGAVILPAQVEGLFSEDGRRFSSRSNGALRVQEVGARHPVGDGPTLGQGVVETKLSRDGAFLVALSSNKTSRATASVWSVAGGERLGPDIPLEGSLAMICLSDDGRHVAIIRGTTLQLYDVANGQESFTIHLDQSIKEARFSPDSGRIAVTADKNVEVWNLTERRRLFPPLQHEVPVRCLEFSPDSRWLATGCLDKQMTECAARIWDAASGQSVGVPLQHGDGILALAFSPNGRRIATASEDFTARVWETTTGQPLTLPLQHRNQVQDVSFTPDGRWLATASSDESARVWDAETGDPITPPLWVNTGLRSVQFDADAARLIARSQPDHAWIWELARDARPIEDLVLLSQVLTGFRNPPAGYSLPGTAQDQLAAWQRLKSLYPQDFTVRADAILAWHSEQALLNQKEDHWTGVVFHLEQMLKLAPEDSVTRDRLREARQHLAPGAKQ